MIIKGRNLMLFVTGTDGELHLLAYGRECTIEKSVELKRVDWRGAGGWERYRAGRRSWSMAASGLIPATGKAADGGVDVEALLTAGTAVTAVVGMAVAPDGGITDRSAVRPNGYWLQRGSAVISAVDYTGGLREAATRSLTLTGTGPLEALVGEGCERLWIGSELWMGDRLYHE